MPIPKPRSQEEHGDYIGRCMDAIGGEYDDKKQAVAICNSEWDEVHKGMAKGKERTVEIFAVGMWNGMDFTVEDLKSMAAAFHAFGDNHQVPLKMGHNDEQPFTDGQPALGWVTDVWVDGTTLMSKFTDIPEVVDKAMEQKLYRNVSVELDLGVEYKGSYYPWVLSGVALLGADIPAVNTLADLQAYMGRELTSKSRAAFTAIEGNKQSHSFNRSQNMSGENQETIDSLKAQVAALKVEMAKMAEENVNLQRKLDDNSAKFKVVQAAEETRKLNETRSELENKLEGMVKEHKLTPASRDEFMRDFDEAKDKETVVFAVKKLESTIESNPAYFGAEQARKKADQQREEDGKDASDVVLQRTNEYMTKHGEKDFSAAKTAVLRADSELAERYTKGGD